MTSSVKLSSNAVSELCYDGFVEQVVILDWVCLENAEKYRLCCKASGSINVEIHFTYDPNYEMECMTKDTYNFHDQKWSYIQSFVKLPWCRVVFRGCNVDSLRFLFITDVTVNVKKTAKTFFPQKLLVSQTEKTPLTKSLPQLILPNTILIGVKGNKFECLAKGSPGQVLSINQDGQICWA